MVKRKIVMGLLVLGTVGGFAAGFKSMHCHSRARRAAFEEHVADVCVRAAKNAERSDAKGDDAESDDHSDWRKHRHHHW